MRRFLVIWDTLVLMLWADAEKTALQCEELHKRLLERMTRK